MKKKKTNKQFLQQVCDQVGEEYTFLEDYINTDTKIQVRHNICGHMYSVTPNKFLDGKRRCPECNREKMRKRHARTTEEFQKEVIEVVGEEYVVIGEYINAHTEIEMFHTKCENIYEIQPKSILKGAHCRICYYTTYKKTEDFFLKEVYELVGSEYTVLSPFTSTSEKITVKHNKCGRVYDVTPASFSAGKRCWDCSHIERGVESRKTPEEFYEQFNEKFGDRYSVIGEYKGQMEPLLIRHFYCGYEWTVIMDRWLYGDGSCPKCNESRGERRVSEWLDKNNINYTLQYKMDECRDKRVLKFDFGVLAEDDSLRFIIEYDGEHHFMIIPYSRDHKKNLKRFEDLQRRDRIKNDFCRTKGIRLVRIPYWDYDNIEEILRNLFYNPDGLLEYEKEVLKKIKRV